MSITIKIEIDGKEVLNQKIEEVVKNESKNVCMPESYSPYARVFDETNPNWCRDSELNLFALVRLQNYANEKLKAKGFLFLNDVYEMLGFPKTKAGQIVGWIYDEDKPIGDNYIDFGIYKTTKNSNFINGFENSIILDFNVDGSIIDKM